MRKEATLARFYKSPWGTSRPRVHVLTVDELLGGKRVGYPAQEQTNCR